MTLFEKKMPVKLFPNFTNIPFYYLTGDKLRSQSCVFDFSFSIL